MAPPSNRRRKPPTTTTASNTNTTNTTSSTVSNSNPQQLQNASNSISQNQQQLAASVSSSVSSYQQAALMASNNSTPQSTLSIPNSGQTSGSTGAGGSSSSSHSPSRRRSTQPNMARALQHHHQQQQSASVHDNLTSNNGSAATQQPFCSPAAAAMTLSANASTNLNRPSSPASDAMGGVLPASNSATVDYSSFDLSSSKSRQSSSSAHMRQQQRAENRSLDSTLDDEEKQSNPRSIRSHLAAAAAEEEEPLGFQMSHESPRAEKNFAHRSAIDLDHSEDEIDAAVNDPIGFDGDRHGDNDGCAEEIDDSDSELEGAVGGRRTSKRSRRGLNGAVGASGGLSSLMGSSANERQATLAAFGMDEDEIEQRISAMSINGAVPRGQEPPSPAVAYHPLAVVNAHHQPPLHNAAAVARGVSGQHGLAPPMGWQATKHTLKERFSFMFCNEILADVHFIVGRGDQRQRIPAHKFVLSTGSAVFDAMFNGAMAAAGASNGAHNNDDIELPDVEPAAFLALLKFLYSDDVTIGPESVMTTLYTAKKYAVPSLENACVDFLKRNLSPDNAFMLLTQARLFDEPQLAALCLEMIDKHTAEALNAEGFTDIDLETLCAVLERDTLRIREAPLYQAVVRWSTEECHRHQLPVMPEHQRELLSRALSLIRFPLMTVEEFAQSAAQSGILTDRELVNLFLYFTVNPKPTVSFLDVPRCCVTGKEQVVNRFQRIEGRWGYSGTPDRIKFTVDRRIFVVGFGLYGSIHGPTEYQVTIQIIHCGTGKVLATNDTSFSCDGSSSTFRVVFKEPVEITPSVTYIASACLKGPDSHYGTKGLRRIVHQSPSSGCVTFQFTYAAGNNNGTSVEDGQIPEIIFYTKLS
uniref:BTB domain-containing protein n=1 Tax=Plectus sambesii TaxID=2011161 RepID=A0A914WBW4_9BILA